MIDMENLAAKLERLRDLIKEKKKIIEVYLKVKENLKRWKK